jgi:hypothetical protein
LVLDAIQRNVRAGIDMDCDGDGPQDCNDYAWITDMYPDRVIYSMNGRLFQCTYTIDSNDLVTFGTPQPVEMTYTTVSSQESQHHNTSSAPDKDLKNTFDFFKTNAIRRGRSEADATRIAEIAIGEPGMGNAFNNIDQESEGEIRVRNLIRIGFTSEEARAVAKMPSQQMQEALERLGVERHTANAFTLVSGLENNAMMDDAIEEVALHRKFQAPEVLLKLT